MSKRSFDKMLYSGSMFQLEDDLETATLCYQQALSVAGSDEERAHAEVAIASILLLQDEHAQARELLTSALAVLERSASNRPSVELTTAYHLLANCHHAISDFPKAKELYFKALDCVVFLPEDHWIVRTIWTNVLALLDEEKAQGTAENIDTSMAS